MPGKNKDKTYPVIRFHLPEEFAAWLEENHHSSNGIWLKIFKKGADETGISRDEALDEALCYGWIDGQAKGLDDTAWLQKFTPRRPRSLWSKRNTEHIERLTKQGRMKPTGLEEVEKAKEDGRWAKAYAPPSEMTIPDDFMKEISKNEKTLAFFKTLNKTNRYSIAFQLQTAKKPETRQRRMDKIVEMLSKGEKFH